jgi:hypothetical protein
MDSPPVRSAQEAPESSAAGGRSVGFNAAVFIMISFAVIHPVPFCIRIFLLLSIISIFIDARTLLMHTACENERYKKT